MKKLSKVLRLGVKNASQEGNTRFEFSQNLKEIETLFSGFQK
jgi:hypothetical protein